ncbi:cell division protein FtsX [Sphingomonas aracearum]|uniref:Permease n=1 Tax=Sphingomonas aracearum TaxID=2283317 RepID=A0A369VU84_9SPHN|nr:FtsX-like permease family protein [Sphingomonas aracearum]RDE04632.1 permease [Sphingomonas aracearum]
MSTAAARRPLDDRRGLGTMAWIMAVMLFLTVLTGAIGLATAGGTRALDRQLAGRLTVQIVEPVAATRSLAALRLLQALRQSHDVARAAAVDRARLAALLEPWLGGEAADADLPMPALIDVDLAPDGEAERVAALVRSIAPAARVDAHAQWMAPVRRFLLLVTWLAAGLVGLMALATAAVVLLAARAGLETHRPTIEVLHMLGSTDVQVARLFQRRIALDTLGGGAVGTLAALATVLVLGQRLAGLDSGLLDRVTLAPGDWAVLVLLPLAFAALAFFAARVAVLRALSRTL